MNIKISNRLVELRKKNGYSQEELAEKLGLSRQAVSKWERAEASPDIDNLICLAKLYNVSLDELLSSDDEDVENIIEDNKEEKNNNINNERPKEDETNNKDSTTQGIFIKDGNQSVSINGGKIHVIDEDGSSVIINDGKINMTSSNGDNFVINYHKIIAKVIETIVVLLSVITYIILGFTLNDGWKLYWPIILIGISLGSIFKAIVNKKFCDFLFPILIAGIYCLIGMLTSLWHPWWIIFISIPLYYAIFEPIDKIIRSKHILKD